MTITLQYSLKAGKLTHPPPFFFCKTALDVRGLLCLHTSCEIICSSPMKNTLSSLTGIAWNLYIALGSRVIFTIFIFFFNSRTWCISPSVCVVFDFFHQCFIVLFCFLHTGLLSL